MGGIGILINPLAGGNHAVPGRAEALARIAGGNGLVREAKTFERLAAVAREFRDADIEVLAVCGGDGSFFRVLSAMDAAYGGAPLPRFLPLRAGSMNTVANGLGIPRRSPERALAALMAVYRDGNAPPLVRRQLLRVNGEHVGFMSGAGTVVGFLRAYYAGPRSGPLGAAHLVGRLALSAARDGALVREVFRWVNAAVRCDGEAVPFGEFSVIYASVIAQIGLGFRPTYRAGTVPGEFHFVAGPVTAGEFLRKLVTIRRGRPTRSPYLFDRSARRVEVEFASREPYMVDGDVMAPVARLVIETGPALSIIGR